MNTDITLEPNSPSYQRWEKQSQLCKRDKILQVVQAVALTALGIGIVGAGIAVFTFLPPIGFFCVLGGGVLSGMASICGFVFRDKISYHVKKESEEVCVSIRKDYLSMPKPDYLSRSPNENIHLIRERKDFTKKLKHWTRYGLISKENGKELLTLIERDEKIRKELQPLKQTLTNCPFTETEKARYKTQLKEKESECDGINDEWRELMNTKIIPDLPL